MRKCILLLIVVALSTNILISVEFEYKKDPEPTHDDDMPFKTLKLVKKIGLDIDDKNFFAVPEAMAVDNWGNFYVYDRIVRKIFKFNKNFKCIKTFTTQGQGPGEISGMGIGIGTLYCSDDGKLYVVDAGNGKLLIFDRNEKLLREINIADIVVSPADLPYAVDKKGEIWILNRKSYSINAYGSDWKMTRQIPLDRKDMLKSFIHLPEYTQPLSQKIVTSLNSMQLTIDLVSKNRVIGYFYNPTMICLLDKNRIIKKYHILPKNVIKNYKALLKGLGKKRMLDMRVPIAMTFFTDKDNRNFFYIVFDFNTLDAKTRYLGIYKFNLDGNLIEKFKTTEISRIVIKKNKLFYAVSSDGVKIYKEVK